MATTLYVKGFAKFIGTCIGNLTTLLWLAATVKYCKGKTLINKPSILLPVVASINSKVAVPVISLSVVLAIFAVNSITSPSRKKRGALGCTIMGLVVTTLFSLTPKSKFFV